MNEAAALTDPVCGMRVTPQSAHHHDYRTKRYYFCGAGCLARFVAMPKRYLAPPETATIIAADTIYVCPMHAEITQADPGACPLCGMSLEPSMPSLDESDDELRQLQRRFIWTLPLTMIVVVIAMFGHQLDWFAPALQSWVELAFALPVVLWAGQVVFIRALQSLKHRSPNMWTLIGGGTLAAFGYSVCATLAPQWFPAAYASMGRIGVYYEAAATIISLTLLGQILELKARTRTGAAIRALLSLAPATARRVAPDGMEIDIPLAEVVIGDRLRIRPGEKVPVDGVVVEGESAVDEAMLSGEAMPVTKQIGDRLIGASMNTSGTLIMRATGVGADTVLARIVALVAEAQRTRAPLQRVADVVAAYFVTGVAAIASLSFVLWGLFGPEPSWVYGFINAVAVLIIACPCALGLATPMSIMVASGRAASSGILFRDAAAIERLGAVDTLVVDKTGTLTAGKPSVVRILSVAGKTADEVLAVAASLEQGSEHPLATAIVRAARERGLALNPTQAFNAHAGSGVEGLLGELSVVLGNAALMRTRGIDVDRFASELDALAESGASVVYLAIAEQLAGAIALADTIKQSTPAALSALAKAGIRVIMASGDSTTAAQSIGGSLGLAEIHGGLSPQDKQALVARLQASGRTVAFAGDGINDAPALAQANVGIAMGTGTDVAMHSAAITLVKGDLRGIALAHTLSRATLRNMRQNLAFALLYNAIGVPIAAGVLYPLTGWLLSPMVAAAAMSLSSVSVIANALRLGRANLLSR